jgi:hypothetical protein
MMSLFAFRKPSGNQPPRDLLKNLRTTLARLDAEPEQTPQIDNLKRILAGRIAELERPDRLEV